MINKTEKKINKIDKKLLKVPSFQKYPLNNSFSLAKMNIKSPEKQALNTFDQRLFLN